MTVIEEIKEKVNCIQMAQQLGLPISRPGDRCKSFRVGSTNTSSLMVNERDFWDFGISEGGDVIDMYAQANGVDNGQAIREMAAAFGVSQPQESYIFEFNRQTKLLDRAAELFSDNLVGNSLAYLKCRGIKESTAKQLKIGYGSNIFETLTSEGFTSKEIDESGVHGLVGRIIFPYIVHGRVKYMVGRDLANTSDAKYKKLQRNDYNEHPIWGTDTLSREGPVVIAEGIVDAISCYQEGMPVITPVTGSFSKSQRKELIPLLRGHEVIVAMDYDPKTQAGQKFTRLLAAELFKNGINTRVLLLDGGEKKSDLNEIYSDTETLDIVFTAEPYIFYRTKQITDEAELESFLREAVEVVDIAQIKKLEQQLIKRDEFDQSWLKAVIASLFKPPTEDFVVRKMHEDYQMVYTEELGWYMYEDNLWRSKKSTAIKAIIAEIVGKYRTGRLLNSAYSVAESEFIYDEGFNLNHHQLDLRNGMLNTNTRALAQHSPDYMSTIKCEFNYDPLAKCPNWKNFINEITDGDLDRIALLKQVSGYILTKDTRYQKCFFLIGEGSNGKSVFMDVLEALVDPGNVSYVELSDLNDHFQRISLHGKMINMATEIKSDVKGISANYKKIVAGEPISGSFKGKDFITFRPFCKMIFSLNNMIVSNDISHGFIRRMVFIDFPVKFSTLKDLPDGAKRADLTLKSKLLGELPGILNWALDGLKDLHECGQFIKTDDQEKYVRDFLMISNPLLSYIEDNNLTGRDIQRKVLYDEYKLWVIENGHRQMSAKKFIMGLKEMFETEERKSSGYWHIRFIKQKVH